MTKLSPAAKPCEDCVAIHGDDPQAWLAQWPAGAEYRKRHDAWLCDGCEDARLEDLSPWEEIFSMYF